MGVKYSSITENGSIIDALITDRTASDVSKAVSLAQKISTGNATEAEITEFLTVMKGSYNYTDMNRVGQAVTYLRDRLRDDAGTSVEVSPKTDWSNGDIPTPEQAAQYISNVKNIRAAFILPENTPPAPESLSNLTHSQANDIETIFQNLDKTIESLKITLITSGEVFSGEV